MQTERGRAWRVIGIQVAAVLVLAVGGLLIGGVRTGYAVVLGGGVVVLPTLLFVRHVFSRFRRMPGKVLGAFFVGEILKLVLMAVLFVLVLQYMIVPVLPLFIGFVGAILAFWLAPLWVYRGSFGQ